MTKKFPFLLFDANIVLELFRQSLWEAVVNTCDVWLGETVVQESRYFENDRGDSIWLRKEDIVCGKKVKVFSLKQSFFKATIDSLDSEFGLSIAEDVHPGEAELLALLLKSKREFHICSADNIVYRILGLKLLGVRGISLEEVLGAIGFERILLKQYTKRFRERCTNAGIEERPCI